VACLHPVSYIQASNSNHKIHPLIYISVVQIAGADPLRDEGLAYADKLIRAGVRTTVKVYPGLPHGFYFFAPLKAARQYLQEVSDFIRSVQAPLGQI
jgi:acetyl esterase/lipase